MLRLQILLAVLLALLQLTVARVPIFQQNQEIMGTPAVAGRDKWSWTDCGLPTDAAHIDTIAVSPDPPRPGQNMTVTVTGTVKETIEDGSEADVAVKLGLLKLLTRTFDLCEEARENDAEVQCPIEAGYYEVSQTVALPKEIPPAVFSVDLSAYTAEGDDLLCLKLKIDFRK
ncbi:hypothetical protein SISSUDRAFT_1057339 [Sistotremastrum suecicum HHB10207 ss-3]|uniref:Phosphatidylglycerol/phosphatidylinositol transfer protein n=1 Tax=Sistotremastrum suecicum HHB10207 ss-3 TaxID=1314776 RepID=A0A166IJG2_9AGAM|nr:hypothetical protein SISSUDRAFT_1057339 [Sistotremastrum suecicum HHB10207 ss-3]